MVYVTTRQTPHYRQISLEELLFGTQDAEADKQWDVRYNTTNTITYCSDKVSDRFLKQINVDDLIVKLYEFNKSTEHLREKPRNDLYTHFHIPKKSGGLRRIDAPKPELKAALYTLKAIFEQDFHALYHTSAFAYIKGRSTVACMKRHQTNRSRWFEKLDIHDFFGSTTLDFVMRMFSMIFPFSEVIKNERGKEELQKALDLAFLNGGLPQGTPISPLITNIMMIPVDFNVNKALRDFKYTKEDGTEAEQGFVYTRYADDFQISSRYDFRFTDIANKVKEVLASFGAPFSLNEQKTRYGSSSGRNWNLGLMLNKDNQITVGHKKKRQLQYMLFSYIMDKQNGVPWDIHDIQTMDGLRSYYRMVEGETIDRIIAHVNARFGVDVQRMIKEDLAA